MKQYFKGVQFKRDVVPIIGAIIVSLAIFVGLVVASTPRPAYPVVRGESYVLSPHPNVVMITLDPSLRRFEQMWQEEIGRRFPDGIGILVHGGDFVAGEWIVGSDPTHRHVEHIEQIIDRTRAIYPNRPIIVLACNTGHIQLHSRPNVFFATSSVWCVPDRALTPEMFKNRLALRTLDDEDEEPAAPEQSRWQTDPDVVGNIFEFIEAI